jgi:hypothetical protein
VSYGATVFDRWMVLTSMVLASAPVAAAAIAPTHKFVLSKIQKKRTNLFFKGILNQTNKQPNGAKSGGAECPSPPGRRNDSRVVEYAFRPHLLAGCRGGASLSVRCRSQKLQACLCRRAW